LIGTKAGRALSLEFGADGRISAGRFASINAVNLIANWRLKEPALLASRRLGENTLRLFWREQSSFKRFGAILRGKSPKLTLVFGWRAKIDSRTSLLSLKRVGRDEAPRKIGHF